MAQRSYAFDKNLLLSDGLTALTADGVAVIGGVTTNSILDLGNARVDGQIVIDVSAVVTANADNIYRLIIQGSNSSTFASGIAMLGQLAFGNTSALQGSQQTTGTGRYEIGFTNEQADTVYRYIRVYAIVTGTSKSITFQAYMAPDPGN